MGGRTGAVSGGNWEGRRVSSNGELRSSNYGGLGLDNGIHDDDCGMRVEGRERPVVGGGYGSYHGELGDGSGKARGCRSGNEELSGNQSGGLRLGNGSDDDVCGMQAEVAGGGEGGGCGSIDRELNGNGSGTVGLGGGRSDAGKGLGLEAMSEGPSPSASPSRADAAPNARDDNSDDN